MRPRTLIVDDHAPTLAALTQLVSGVCDVVGTAQDGEALLREARRLVPDLVILDIIMPVMDGFTAGRQLKIEMPETRLIYVTTLQPDEQLLAEATRIGASAL